MLKIEIEMEEQRNYIKQLNVKIINNDNKYTNDLNDKLEIIKNLKNLLSIKNNDIEN